MRDSRLTEATDHLADAGRTTATALKLVEEIVDELTASNPEYDVMTDALRYLLTARKALELAANHLLRAGINVVRPCGTTNSVGSVCSRAEGHDGPHESDTGFTWTDTSAAAGAAYIASLYNKRGVRD